MNKHRRISSPNRSQLPQIVCIQKWILCGINWNSHPINWNWAAPLLLIPTVHVNTQGQSRIQSSHSALWSPRIAKKQGSLAFDRAQITWTYFREPCQCQAREYTVRDLHYHSFECTPCWLLQASTQQLLYLSQPLFDLRHTVNCHGADWSSRRGAPGRPRDRRTIWLSARTANTQQLVTLTTKLCLWARGGPGLKQRRSVNFNIGVIRIKNRILAALFSLSAAGRPCGGRDVDVRLTTMAERRSIVSRVGGVEVREADMSLVGDSELSPRRLEMQAVGWVAERSGKVWALHMYSWGVGGG